MAQSFVQLPDDSGNTGKKLDTFVTTTAAQHREATVIGDPATDAAVAKVANANPGSTDYGVVVRDYRTGLLDTNLGAQADAASIDPTASKSLIAFFKGLLQILVDVYDSGNHRLNVYLQNATLAVTQSGSWVIAAGTALIGAVTLRPDTANGTLCSHLVAAASTNATVAKNGAGQLYGVHVFSKATYPVYVKVFNKATTPDPTSDTVIRTIGCQSGIRADDVIPFGLPCSSGISFAIVKDIADNGGTAVAAADCVVDIDYK